MFCILSTLIGSTLEPDPAAALLNKKPFDVSQLQCELLLQEQTIAKACKTSNLNITETRNRVTRAMIHAKVEAVLLDRVIKYERMWKPWVLIIISQLTLITPYLPLR